MPSGFSFGGATYPSGRFGSGFGAAGSASSPVGTVGGNAEINSDGLARLIAFILMPQMANFQMGASNPALAIPGGFQSRLNFDAGFPMLGSHFGISANPSMTMSPLGDTGQPQWDPTVTVPLLGPGAANVQAESPLGSFDLRGDVVDPVMSVLSTLLGY